MLLILGRLVRVLAILLLARLVLRALFARRRDGAAEPGAAVPGTLVRDTICNTFLPRERALRAMVAGREQFFCSSGCRDRALGATEALPPPP